MDGLDVPVLQSDLSPPKQPPDGEHRANTVPSSPASSVRRDLSSRDSSMYVPTYRPVCSVLSCSIAGARFRV